MIRLRCDGKTRQCVIYRYVHGLIILDSTGVGIALMTAPKKAFAHQRCD
jgi:hypothetical protein